MFKQTIIIGVKKCLTQIVGNLNSISVSPIKLSESSKPIAYNISCKKLTGFSRY